MTGSVSATLSPAAGTVAETARPIAQFAWVDAVTDPESLATLLGPVASLSRAPLKSPGKSGAYLERLEIALHSGEQVSLVHKCSRLAQDWVRLRTADLVGREAALLAEPRLAAVWEGLVCPYRAFAAGNGEVRLLMDDLSAYLVPEEDAPVSVELEDAVLDAIARIHARFWQSDVLDLAWLANPAKVVGILTGGGAVAGMERVGLGELAHWLREGKRLLSERLSPAVRRLLDNPVDALHLQCGGLPRTLLHGDTRLVNVAYFPGSSESQVALLDWQIVGAGPATLDLGFYLIGNARRRARSPEALIARYRELLERALGKGLDDTVWQRMVDAGLLYGAAFLLWDRALDADDKLPGAIDELEWWLAQLERLVP